MSDPNNMSLNQSHQGFHSLTWSQAIAQLEREGTDYVIATVLGTSGSTPRASGTKMVITGEHIFDTLGGGHLEFKVIEKARSLLTQGEPAQALEQFHLAANLGQCCGGAAVVMFEVMVSEHMQLDVYGAGHVAQALIPILAQLPIRIRWIDNRADVFPANIPANVTKVVDDEPVEVAKRAKAGSAYLILTHNHHLDFELVCAILKRNDALWLGVIGSATKAKRFRHRLAHRDFSPAQIETMICPVGVPNVAGKLPMEVAVSIAGQVIGLYQQQTTPPQSRRGLQWQQLKQAFELSNNEQVVAPTAAHKVTGE
ncbi:xanthine dehydrogenase accessory protein XdhC [Alteromonas sp. ASW11-36]|uniref:Xanthine dehydrogenase accessory protein XdhC n=1 Tax=Alteromonas arenosi TaxID=3055817 RepID=A0ABT7SYS8_9ALTE|nr:xanthine dehydrogenase accessory protein XdhC [Alteromonas sp. ASW11-36]MDM7861342.1 xanthine dehydrogenase accessory protein XdhC [Alteromonas sp. ASW11-36]